jgi:FKBP-type peptidyl-prolyl cis-trans isomerase SlyD
VDDKVYGFVGGYVDEGEDAVAAAIREANEDGHVMLVTVKDVQEDKVIVDANHPLAGKKLHFDVEVTSIRDASDEELQHGHVHGAGGHHH